MPVPLIDIFQRLQEAVCVSVSRMNVPCIVVCRHDQHEADVFPDKALFDIAEGYDTLRGVSVILMIGPSKCRAANCEGSSKGVITP